MTEFDAKILAIANKAVYEAQEENRRLGSKCLFSERDAGLAASRWLHNRQGPVG